MDQEILDKCPACKEPVDSTFRQPVTKRGYWWYCLNCGNQGQHYENYNFDGHTVTTIQLPIRR